MTFISRRERLVVAAMRYWMVLVRSTHQAKVMLKSPTRIASKWQSSVQDRFPE